MTLLAHAEAVPEVATHEAPAEIPFDWPHRALSRFVEAAGCRWHVQRTGSGEALLLLHGTAASTHSWRDCIPELAQHFDVIAVDLPGHGFSQRLPGDDMSLPSISAALCELLGTLGVERAILVGHSAGAAIALDMALRGCGSPPAVIGINAALLPFGGVLRNLFSPMAQFFSSTRLLPAMLARRARDPRAVRRVLDGTGSKLGPDALTYYQRLFRREGHLSAVLSMMASWDLAPLLSKLQGFEAHLLLITGLEDKAVSPREAQRIARIMPAATVMDLDGLGHLAHEEQPGMVCGHIRDFVEEVRKC